MSFLIFPLAPSLSPLLENNTLFFPNPDQLDGLRKNRKKHSSKENHFQIPDNYNERQCISGKKRVSYLFLTFLYVCKLKGYVESTDGRKVNGTLSNDRDKKIIIIKKKKNM